MKIHSADSANLDAEVVFLMSGMILEHYVKNAHITFSGWIIIVINALLVAYIVKILILVSGVKATTTCQMKIVYVTLVFLIVLYAITL